LAAVRTVASVIESFASLHVNERVSLRRFLLPTVAVTAIFTSVPAARAISPAAMQQIQGLLAEKSARTTTQQKIGSQLIYGAKQTGGASIAPGVASLQLRMESDAQRRVLVDIAATPSPGLLAQIATVGGEVVTAFPRYRAIQAWLPLEMVEPLAARSDVSSIRSASRPVHRKLTTSEGDVAHRANLARATFGIDGTGAKVGVLSDSVDHLATVQGSGDVGPVTVLPGLSGMPGSGEGTALMEIVYDLAPGASLFFATTGSSEAAMATNIQALRAAGCDIIFDDVVFFTEPVFQDGIIAQAVETVAADGALYVSAAGNGGNQDDGTSGTWEGDFAPSSATIDVGGGNTEVLHDFGDGSGLDTMTAAADMQPSEITLQWSDAFGASANDYDLFVIRGDSVIAASTDTQNGTQDPFEAIDTSQLPRSGAGLSVAIGQFSGSARFLHLDTNGGRLAIQTAGEVYGHSTAVDAMAIAAVDSAGLTVPFTTADRVERYTSDGPRRMFYDSGGLPITPGDFLSSGGALRQKPDIAAADCVMVSTPGFNPFCGTSASTAHTAAIAALVKSANPGLGPSAIRDALTSTALDIEAPGVDRDAGFGLLDAFGAVQAVVPIPTPIPGTPAAGCVGDCNGNGTVSVDELITGVDIALGADPLTTCPALNCDGTGTVTVDCLVKAVDSALHGCRQ
jgi:hypothetical protein